jgi:transcription termination factor NusB
MTPPQDRPRRDRPAPRKPHRPPRKPLDPARQAAFDVLRAVRERDAYPNLLLPVLLRERGISGRDAAFATELTYGSSRIRGLLDAVIAAAADRSPDVINPVLLDLLRLGTYQLLRTRVDAHAAVSTTVEQAAIEFDSSRAGFVNGVLRTISTRDEESWLNELAPDKSADPIGNAAFLRSRSSTRWAPPRANSAPLWPPTMRARRSTSRPGPVCSPPKTWPPPSTAAWAGSRRMRCTCRPVTPRTWPRSVAARPWFRTRAANW